MGHLYQELNNRRNLSSSANNLLKDVTKKKVTKLPHKKDSEIVKLPIRVLIIPKQNIIPPAESLNIVPSLCGTPTMHVAFLFLHIELVL